jgi:autoinducer 2-degrading protein
MYTVSVRLEVHPDKLDEFVAGIHANARASLKDEPGCLRFDVHRDRDEPTVFYFYEIYIDRRAFEVAHRSAPHYADWQRVVASCVVTGTQKNTYSEPLFPQDIPEDPARRTPGA